MQYQKSGFYPLDAIFPDMQNAGMIDADEKSVLQKRLEGMLALRKKKPAPLAKELGLSDSFIRDILRGKVKSPRAESLDKLARELGTSSDYLLGHTDNIGEPPGTVPLVGYVGAGAEAHYYASSDVLDQVDAPDDATESTVAVEVRGGSLGSLFERWIVFYDDVRSPVTPDMYGHLCVVGLANDSVLIKQIKPSKSDGRFHLLSNTEDPIFDAEVLWAAKVRSMRPA